MVPKNHQQHSPDPSGGANQSRLRAYNERVILSVIRREGAIAKAELAKLTGLTAQSMSVIIRGLEQEKLLLRGEPLKGKVGQPSIPMRLNPEGVFTLGLKIGRRRTELVLVDFVGRQRAEIHMTYSCPIAADILAFVAENMQGIIATLPKNQQKKIVGLGVAMPYELWNWAEKIGASPKDIESWRTCDLRQELTAICDYPVTIQNDATSACAAELVFGSGVRLSNFGYIYIGFFIGGGIVLNHSIFPGPQGNAGAFGPMPVTTEDGKRSQLIEHASMSLLEQRLHQQGIDPLFLWESKNDWSDQQQIVDEWVNYISRHIATAIVASCSVIDFSHFVIDGAFPNKVRAQIVAAINREFKLLDRQGIITPDVSEAQLSRDPRVLGSASLPLFEHYLLDQNLLFKA